MHGQKKEMKLQALLHQIVVDTQKFLAENPALKFYSVGFDCNAEYAEILLCFNTEEAFQKTLKHYQSGKYGHLYQTEEQIFDLRFNTGDWDYQGVSAYTAFSEDELTELYQEDYEKMRIEMMDFNYQLMQKFCQTACYKSIPKTNNFRPICIDHEEDVDYTIKQTEQLIQDKKE